MKIRSALLVALFAVPLAVSAQVTTVFSDNFSGGSTLNAATPTAPTAISTTYEEISAKTWSPNPPTIANGLKFGIVQTTGGGCEVQALFTTSPVTLLSVGDYVQITVTFTNTIGLLTQDTEFGIGLFNSGGFAPFGGGLNGNDQSNSTPISAAITNGAANWNGYLAEFAYPTNLGGGKNSEIISRPPQTGPDNRNQVTVVPSGFSNLYGYSNPGGSMVGIASSAPNIALVAGGTYTEVLNFTLQPNGALQITASLYTNTIAGALLTTMKGTTSGTPVTNSFDAFSIGWRSGGNSNNTTIVVSSVQAAKYIQSEASCIIAAFENASSMETGQTNGYVNISIPTNSTLSGAVSVQLVSTNPAVLYPSGAPGGTLTVTFPQGAPYTTTNVPLTVAGIGFSQLYLTNATSPNCISQPASTTVVNVTPPPGVFPTPVLPTIPGGIFNITNYGAIGDGATTNTVAVQNTIDAALAAGGGTVELPAGTFLCGPLVLGSHIRFQIDAGSTLLLLPYGSYPGGTSPPNFIDVQGANDIEFCGPGTINGQGAAWWAANIDSSAKPYILNLNNCVRVFIHDWNSMNPPMKQMVFGGTDSQITIQNCTNTAAASSGSTDCLDLQGAYCLVQNCVFYGGDDNIAIAGGYSQNILITNITCGIGHGISIGSDTSQGVSNVMVVNCTFNRTDNGIRLKADNDRGGVVQNITYQNITMTNVQAPIVLFSYYNESSPNKVSPSDAAGYPATNVTSLTPIWRDITISNVTATYTTYTELAGVIWGRPEMLVSNVTLSHVNISAPKSFNIYNARGINIVDSQFGTPGTTLNLYNAQVTITNSVLGAAVTYLGGLASTNALALYNAPVSLTTTDLLAFNPLTFSGSTVSNAGNLVLPAATSLNFVVGTNLSKLVETGNLTLNSTFNITNGNGFGTGTYTLLPYTGTLSGSPKLGATPIGYNCSLNTSTAGQVKLVVSSKPPSIGNIQLAGGLLAVSGTGGGANATYYVLSSTNVALPLFAWTRLATNQFDMLGNFSFTTVPNTNMPKIFYALQVP